MIRLTLFLLKLQVIWSPPDPQQINGINQGYKVEAWFNGAVEKSIRVGPSTGDPRDDQEEIFGGLAKYRSYNITVLCYTSAGDGPRSEELTVCTKQDIPGPVKRMTFENVLDSSLELLWEPPQEPNGIILGMNGRHVCRTCSVTCQMSSYRFSSISYLLIYIYK